MKSLKLLQFCAALLLLAALAAGYAFFWVDKIPPQLSLSLEGGQELPPLYEKPLGPQSPLKVEARDEDSGLARIRVELLHQGKSHPVLERSFEKDAAGGAVELDFTLALASASLEGLQGRDTRLTLLVTARDRGGFFWGRGNERSASYEILLDLAPPAPVLPGTMPEIVRGGSALLVFGASEPLKAAFLEFAGERFPARPGRGGLYACLFAWPHEREAREAEAFLTLTDLAGNTVRAALRPRLRDQSFREDKIRISDKFLREKREEFLAMLQDLRPDLRPAAPAAEEAGAPSAQPGDLELFRLVNEAVRADNYAELKILGAQSAELPFWEGALLRLPRSTQRSNFADRRVYLHNGKIIDRRRHMGLDLASFVHDKVPAAGAGKVLKTGYLGIHGRIVLLDHGLGLQTLYSHLSDIRVREGQLLRRGDTVGLTGKSGMAGGDHLHFETLVSGVSVNPEEWLNPAWTSRIDKALSAWKPEPAPARQ